MSSNFINVPRLHSYCAPLSNNNLIFCILLFLFLRTFHNKNYCKKYSNELTLCNKLWFSNPNIFGFQRRKPLKFQTMTFVRSNNISLKYQRFTTLGSKDIGIRKSEFVAKSQFIWESWKFVVSIWEGINFHCRGLKLYAGWFTFH